MFRITKITSFMVILSLIVLTPHISMIKAESPGISISSTNLTGQEIEHYANGILLTLSPSSQSSNLLNEIKPKLFRSQNPWLFQNDSYNRVVSNGGIIQYLVYETFFTANYGKNIWPGDNGDWTTWENSVRTAVQYVLDHNMTVDFEIWNEPNYDFFWQRDQSRFFETWKRAYLVIKQMVPNARTVGPSLGTYDFEYLKNFLSYTKNNNVLPTTLTWHELDSNIQYTQIQNRINEVKNWMSSNGISNIKISINEIVSNLDFYNPGLLVSFFKVLEENQVLAAHACWDDPKNGNISNCWNSTLNGLLTGNFKPRSTWWVYKYYSELTGKLLKPVFNSSNLSGIAAANESNKEVKLLIGANNNAANNITINYKSPWNSNNVQLEVDTYTLTNTSGDEVTQPIINSQTVDYSNGDNLINIGNLGANQAVYIKIIETKAITIEKPDLPNCLDREFAKEGKCLPLACKADYNSDGVLNIGDFSLFASNYKKPNISCDLDIVRSDSCFLDIQDFAQFALGYKKAGLCAV